MGTITISSASSYEVLPEDIFVARFAEYTPEEGKVWKQGEVAKPQFRCTFEIVKDSEGGTESAGRKISTWVNIVYDQDGNVTVHPKSNFYKLLCTLQGKTELADGDSFDLDELIDNLVRIDVRIGKKADGSDKNTVNEVRPMIKRTVPVKAKPPPKTAVVAERTGFEAEDDDNDAAF